MLSLWGCVLSLKCKIMTLFPLHLENLEIWNNFKKSGNFKILAKVNEKCYFFNGHFTKVYFPHLICTQIFCLLTCQLFCFFCMKSSDLMLINAETEWIFKLNLLLSGNWQYYLEKLRDFFLVGILHSQSARSK